MNTDTPTASTPKKQKKGKDKAVDQKKAKRKGKDVLDEDADLVVEEEAGQVKETSDAESGSDSDAGPPLHETLQNPSKRKRKRANTKKEKYVPEGETKEQRDARSIFIGNLPVTIVKSRVCLIYYLYSESSNQP